MKEGRKYLEQHLPQVAAGQEWLSLDGCKVAEILSSDRLQCREEEVWMAAVKWAENQEKLDNKEWLAILKEVRLDLIKLDFYEKNVKPHPLMEKTEDHHSPSVPRTPPIFLLVLGGWQLGGPTSDISVYNPRADMWHPSGIELPFPWAYMESVTHNNNIYLAGGSCINDGVVRLHRNIWRLGPDMTFTKLSHMRQRRNFVGLAETGGEIFAMGGLGGGVGGTAQLTEQRLNSVEVYNIDKNQWRNISPMNKVRSDLGAAAVKGTVFAVGGFDGVNPTRSVERYCPKTGTWRLMPQMAIGRSGVKCASLGSLLLAVGGWDGAKRLTSGEIFDTATNKWRFLPDMETPRSNHTLALVEGSLIAVGGYQGTNPTSHVELLDWDGWRWVSAGRLPWPRSAPTSAVIATAQLAEEIRERFRSNRTEKSLEMLSQEEQEDDDFFADLFDEISSSDDEEEDFSEEEMFEEEVSSEEDTDDMYEGDIDSDSTSQDDDINEAEEAW